MNSALVLPAGSLVGAALSLVRETVDKPIVDHSLRSFFFARLTAQQEGLLAEAAYDEDLLFAATAMHDLGLGTLAAGRARSRKVSKSGVGPSSVPRCAKNRTISHATVSRSSSSRPPGNNRYTVARETPDARAASSIVVLPTPTRAMHSKVPASTRSRESGGAEPRVT